MGQIPPVGCPGLVSLTLILGLWSTSLGEEDLWFLEKDYFEGIMGGIDS